MLFTIVAILLICVATSTREGRAEAKIWLKPYERIANMITFLIVTTLALSWYFGPRK